MLYPLSVAMFSLLLLGGAGLLVGLLRAGSPKIVAAFRMDMPAGANPSPVRPRVRLVATQRRTAFTPPLRAAA